MDAAILAGGRARRFGGRDKSALDVGPVSILDRQLAVLRTLTDRILVVTASPGRLRNATRSPRFRNAARSRRFRNAARSLRFRNAGVETVAHAIPGAGPLGGIYTALTASRTSHTLILACDLPFVTASFLGRLASLAGPDADAVVPRGPDGWQPLCAVYAASLAPIMRRRIEVGHLKIVDLLSTLRVREVSAEEIAVMDPDGLLFLNVNSPADLGRANRLAARGPEGGAGRRNTRR